MDGHAEHRPQPRIRIQAPAAVWRSKGYTRLMRYIHHSELSKVKRCRSDERFRLGSGEHVMPRTPDSKT